MPCYHCQKGIIHGHSHTHHRGVAGGRWKKRAPKTARIFFPNLQKVEVIENGETKNVKLCTKCLKRIKKDIRDKKQPFLTVVKLQELKKDYAKVEKAPATVVLKKVKKLTSNKISLK